jgi:tetratricopeptide (TPR) repeat protein
VVGVGLAVRIAHLVDLARLPLFDRPTVDAALYADMARGLARSCAYPDVFFKPPLYPYALAALWRLVGENYFLLRCVGVLSGAASCGLAWWTARRLFGAPAALVAGLLYALHRTAVYFEGELLEIGLVTCLHAAALVLLLRAAGKDGGRLPAAVAGLVLGLGTVARPTLLLFDSVALAWLGRRRGLVAAAGLAAAILPVTLHNAIRGGDLVLVSSNLGVNFYLGNNPRADGRIAAATELPANPAAADRAATQLAEAAAGHALRPSQVSRYWLARGLAWDAANPGPALGLLLRKLFFAWNGAEISDNEDLAGLRRHLRVFAVLPVGTYLLAPLGLAGLLLAPRRPDVHLARWFVLAQMASLLPFFVVARFRLPWMPVLAVFAAWSIVSLARRAAARRGRLLAITGAAALLCNLPAFGVRAPVDFDLDYKLGYAYQERGETEAALAAYREAVRRNPENALARNALGVLLAESGRDLDDALALVRRALELDPARASNYQESLAGIHLRRGEPEAAVAACMAGLDAPAEPATRAALFLRRAEAERALGRPAAEAVSLRAALAAGLAGPRAEAARRRLDELR